MIDGDSGSQLSHLLIGLCWAQLLRLKTTGVSEKSIQRLNLHLVSTRIVVLGSIQQINMAILILSSNQ